MKLASLIAFVACAACLGAMPAPVLADAGAVAGANAGASAQNGAPSSQAPKRRTATARSRSLAPDDTPFSFRDIPLGITLDALRATRMVRATPHDSTLVCETDVPGGDIGMTLKTRANNTVACRWAHRTTSGWVPSHAVVAGAPSADHVLRFAHDSPGEPLRLYEMSFVVDGMAAFDLRDMLAARYGKPRILGEPALPLFEWENASSTITICLLPDSGRATLTYLLKPASPRAKAIERTLKISQFDEG